MLRTILFEGGGLARIGLGLGFLNLQKNLKGEPKEYLSQVDEKKVSFFCSKKLCLMKKLSIKSDEF
jgi:hypothetical protein